jgi:uncharacterized DUF497 family protein
MPHDEDALSFEGFEWDADKRRSNLLKHGIDFGSALPVFTDPAAVMLEPRTRDGETRHLIAERLMEDW